MALGIVPVVFVRRVTLLVAASVVALASCGTSSRTPRHTILTNETPAPPPPPPEPNEVRLQPGELFPGAPDPVELAPSTDLGTMVHRALDAAQSDLIQCYLEILPESPDATGSVEVQIDLTDDGHVTRVVVDQLSTNGFERIVPCVRGVITSLRVHDAQARGHYVSRVYTFHSTAIDRQVSDTFTIRPPPRPPRPVRAARRRHGAPAPVASAAPTSSAPPTPPARPGVLQAAEIVQTLAENSTAFQACYGSVLRRSRHAAGTATATFTITRRGTVENAQLTSSMPALASAANCTTEALRGVHFRASGIETHVRQPVEFRP